MNKNKWAALALAVLNILLAVLSLLLLPETVVTQFSVGSEGVTTMPRIAAVALPALIGLGGAFAVLFSHDDTRSAKKGLLASAVGVLVFVVMLAVNL